MADADFIVIGAGSAGCTAAAGLAQAGRVTLVEAGPSDAHPLVRMPFGLVWLLGSRRDWRYVSVPQAALDRRRIAIPRGRMVGGSGSINSMLWFRGREDDFDGWQVPGWTWEDVRGDFEAVEAAVGPCELAHPHPLTRGLRTLFGNGGDSPTPERESAGVGQFNLVNGRRHSAADALLRPAEGVSLLTGRQVARLMFRGDRAAEVEFSDGSRLRAAKGIVLSAGSIGSPGILLRSGIGPAEDLRAAGVPVVRDAPEVGANLHDHPAVGLHFAGSGSGYYGLSARHLGTWALAPFQWALAGRGVLASPTVEGAAFFDSTGAGGVPDVQSHFIPFLMNWTGGKYRYGQGYFADACLCRPRSRGRLRLTRRGLEIDPGLLSDEADLEIMLRGISRLRDLLAQADFGRRRAQERFPGPELRDDAALRANTRARCGTAYHPVGTLRLGGPVTPRLRVAGVDGLWVADASVMPKITSANTNAPSMMIGHRGARMIGEDAA